MKVLKFTEENGGREAWLNARLGKITGSRLRDVLPARDGSMKRAGWELVAERLLGSAALAEEETPLERGTRLEPEALTRFAQETGKKVDTSLLLWMREDDESIALSPDGVIGKTAACEVKCLNAASHIEAKVTGKIPKNTGGYDEQAVHYFVVNDDLKTLYFIFYDPRFPAPLDFFYLTIKRKDVQDKVEEYLAHSKATLAWVRQTVNSLTF